MMATNHEFTGTFNHEAINETLIEALGDKFAGCSHSSGVSVRTEFRAEPEDYTVKEMVQKPVIDEQGQPIWIWTTVMGRQVMRLVMQDVEEDVEHWRMKETTTVTDNTGKPDKLTVHLADHATADDIATVNKIVDAHDPTKPSKAQQKRDADAKVIADAQAHPDSTVRALAAMLARSTGAGS